MGPEIKKGSYRSGLIALSLIVALVAVTHGAEVGSNFFCDSGSSLSGECTVNENKTLDDGDIANGEDLILDAKINSSGKYTLNFSGEIDFRSNSVLGGAADVFASSIVNRGNIELEESSPGNFLICQRTGGVNCTMNSDSGVSVNASYGRSSERAVFRTIESEWNKGFLNWTEDASLTSQLDSSFNDFSAEYTVNKVKENTEFQILENGNIKESRKPVIDPEYLNDGSFITKNSDNLTAGEKLKIELESAKNSDIGENPSAVNAEIQQKNNLIAQEDLIIEKVLLYSEVSQNMDYSLYDSSGSTYLDGTYNHEGTGWNKASIGSEVKLEKGKEYTLRITPGKGDQYKYEGEPSSDGGIYTIDSGIEWRANNVENFAWTMGLEVSSGYKDKGTYNSTRRDLGETVEWVKTSIESTLPQNTSYDISFRTNESSGKWKYYDDINSVPDSRFIGYNITLETNKSFNTPKIDTIRLGYNPPGPDGSINFTATLNESSKNFIVRELSAPVSSNLNQERNLIGAPQSNNLSALLEDAGSGIAEAIVATNETGTLENRSGYSKNYNLPASTTSYFIWKNESIDTVEDVEWQIWFRDASGNWNSTDAKTFTVDGKGPQFSDITYPQYFDVDNGTAEVDAKVTDELESVDTVVFEVENTSGEFNRTLTPLENTNDYSTLLDGYETPQKVNFTFYANDTLENWNSVSRTINFQNISISQSLSPQKVNSSESFTVSGNLELKPENTPVTSETVEIWTYTDTWTRKKETTTDGSGDYSTDISINRAGMHDVKVNATNENGISGESSRKVEVSLDITQDSSVFNHSGNSHADVDRDDRVVNLTAEVSEPVDTSVSSVQAEIETPEGGTRTFEMTRGDGRTWFNETNTSAEFGDLRGEYTVTYSAETGSGIRSNYPQSSFYVENISVNSSITDLNVSIGEETTISGNAWLEPYKNFQDYGNVTVEVEDGETSNFSLNSGEYTGQIKTGEPGNKTVNITYENQNGIKGYNTTYFYAYNLSARIKDVEKISGDQTVGKNHFYKNSDLQFYDNVSADSQNIFSNFDVNLDYYVPSGWSVNYVNTDLGEIQPGEWKQHNPEYEIPADAELGPQQINISTDTRNDIVSRENLTVELWSKSDSNYINLDNLNEGSNIINREREIFPVIANVTDYYSGEPIAGINTTLAVDNILIHNTSNSTGGVRLELNVSKLDTGEQFLTLDTKNNPEKYLNRTSNTPIAEVSVKGVMQKGTQSPITPVYRKNSSSNPQTAISGFIEDSTGSGIEDAITYLKINNRVKGPQNSSQDGGYIYNYNPKKTITPGLYNATINASKNQFADFSFNRTVEVRGKLDIENLVDKNIIQRGLKHDLNSEVVDEFNNRVKGNVSWKVNSTGLGSGENISVTVPETLQRGSYNLSSSTGLEYFDDDTSSRDIEIYGLASVELKPEDFTIRPGNTVTLEATVSDDNTSSVIENYPVTFTIDGTEYTRFTNTSGIATYDWTVSEGNYDVEAKITDNSSLNYNVTDSIDTSEVFVGEKLYLDEYEFSNKDIYRYFKTPYRTVFNINLTRTSNTIDRVPVGNEKVEFTVNGSTTISCTTDSTGSCSEPLIYDPDSSVSAGNLTVKATTDRPDWIDVNAENNLVVRGQLITTLNSPSNDVNIARGDNIDLSATTDTLVGGQVQRNLTWNINGRTVATGYDTEWTVGDSEPTGQATLRAVGDGEFFEQDTDDIEVWILGNADVELLSPSNNSQIGFKDSKTVECTVIDDNSNKISGYPVEFVDNRTGSMTVFETSETGGNDKLATASWQPPESIGEYKMGCRISTNRSVGYQAVQETQNRVYSIYDNVKPEITNVKSPRRVSPGEVAKISFNSSDEVAVDNVNATVLNPFFNEIDYSDINIVNEKGTGYRVEVDTEGRSKGTYQATIEVNDTSGNEETVEKAFNVQPGGLIDVEPKEITAENITQISGKTDSVNVSLLLDNGGNLTNITASSQSPRIEFNTTKYECGEIQAGSYCNRTFEVNLKEGTSPTGGLPIFASFQGTWRKNVDGETSSLGDFTEINVESNPVFNETTGNRTGSSKLILPHGTEADMSVRRQNFSLNSSGNSPVTDYRAEFKGNELNESWVTVINDAESSIMDGSTAETDIRFDIPVGTSPSETGNPYTGKVEFTTSNSRNFSRKVAVEVPQDPQFEIKNSIAASAVRGSNGTLGKITVESLGNIDLTIEPKFSTVGSPNQGPCAQRISSEESPVVLEKQTTKEIKINYDFRDPPEKESCEPRLTLDPTRGTSKSTNVSINVRSFSISAIAPATTTMPGENGSLEFRTDLGDTPQTDDINYEISIDGKKAAIIGERINSTDWFEINYTIPEVADAKTHDIVIEANQTEFGITRNKVLEDKITVPDITPPQFQFFDIQGVDPNETQEIEVPVSDNSGTVENVSMRLEGPENVSNYSLSKVTGEEKWSLSIPEVEKGVYRANFTAYDPSGFSSSVVDKFRVSSNTTFDGSFTTPDGGKNSGADLVFTDSETNRSVPASIGGSGIYSVDLKEGNYDVTAEFDNQQVRLQNTPVDENTSGFRAEKLTEVETSGLTPADRTDARVMGIGVDTGLEPESATITFNYSEADIPSGYSLSELEVARCPDYNYGSLTCDSSSFETFEVGRLDVNKAKKTITVDVSGFSSYTLFAPAEGSNESDEPDQPDDSGGGGGGGGALGDAFEDLNESVSETQEEVENLSERLNDTETPGAELGSSSINAELRPGEQKTVSLSVSNTANDSQTFVFGVDEIISDYVSMSDTATLESGESRDVLLNISAPADELAGSYSGTLSIESDEINTNIPVNVQVLPPQDELLDMSLNPVFSSVEPGDALQVEATFSNQGYARNVDVTTVIDVLDPDTNETIASLEETVAVGTTLNRVVEIDIPEDTQLKSYAIRGSARYTNLDVARVATAASSFEVDQPFWSRDIFGFTYGNIALGFILILLVSAIGFSIYYYRRKQALKKKRYMENIDLDTIPSGGNNQAYLGELAEVGTRTFSQLDDLTTHALIAGATGSGKTVTGQVMVEEALENGANVIVLDPTAQWTGYLRENKDQNMLDLYDDYGMRQSDARAFDGNIRAVEPGEDIDITPYLEQDEDGQIIIFSLHKLDSKNIDEFANRTIQQIFDANLPERDGLETIIVYDEVHRLLEKFGGNGEGLKQLERGAREFRKWGVGMVLLSQVISDFSGEIRANIGTTIQMRTQYDDDLERIREKFGIDTVKSIAKAEVGSGMLQNSDYNHGRPYFVDFRPLLHSPHRLSDEELEKYEDYNKRVDAIEEKVDQLEEQGEDVYEYRSELKLTKRNLKKGSFSLVDTYIEELEEKLDI